MYVYATVVLAISLLSYVLEMDDLDGDIYRMP